MPEHLADQAAIVRPRIAANFADLLRDQRWSYRAAALRLGLTHTYVTARANGSVEMSGSDLALFADFLSVPVSRFFEVHENGPVPEETGPAVPPTVIETATFGTNVRRFPIERVTPARWVESEEVAPVTPLRSA